MKKAQKIAVIAGDGIGREVMPEGLRVLQAANRRFDLGLAFTHFDWAHCDYYLAHGQMMPDDWKQQLSGFDAIFLRGVHVSAVNAAVCGSSMSTYSPTPGMLETGVWVKSAFLHPTPPQHLHGHPLSFLVRLAGLRACRTTSRCGVHC
ncbi:MAG: hypothetical protein JZU64_09370 [Rhodoferax sp.]|nr:hypothetical protein [Rhodoferax sp.]